MRGNSNSHGNSTGNGLNKLRKGNLAGQMNSDNLYTLA